VKAASRGHTPWRTAALSTLSACVIIAAAWHGAPHKASPLQDSETFFPTSDTEIVDQFPASSGASKRDFRQRLELAATDGTSVEVAVAMARRHLERARREGEPREAGLARSALGGWWDLHDVPVPVLLVRAAIRQHDHDFAGALGDLERAIAADPRNVQAWLSQAAIQQTTGRLREAVESCRRIVALSNHIAGHVCLADLASMQGDQDAFERIGRRLEGQKADAAQAGWILTVQAEMAERLGRNVAAEGLFRAAVTALPGSYARVAYADFLLANNRAGEVDALLAAAPPTDAVLLRRAIALKRRGNSHTEALSDELRQRFAPPVGGAGTLHLRELARFQLEIEGDARTALELARRNWTLQKEPADALLLAAAARAAHEPDATAPVRAFVRDPGLFDVRLHALLD
jgi:tetratricopeptide (TPR) repeat protein